MFAGNLLANGDYDPDGTDLMVMTTPVKIPANGTFSIQSNGDYEYTPAATFGGNDTIVVSLCDNGIPLPSICGNDTIIITVMPAIIATAGDDLQTCGTSSITLSGANVQNSGAILWTTNGTGNFDAPTITNPVYSPSLADVNTGEVVLTMHVSGIAPCGDFDDALTLTFAAEPVAFAGNDGTICNSALYPLSSAMASNYSSVLWEYNPTNSGTLSDAASLNPTFSPNQGYTGIVTLTLKATGNTACGLKVANDEMKLTVVTGIVADAGNTLQVVTGSIVTLHGTVSGGTGSYAWSWEPSDLLKNNNVPEPVTLPLTQQTIFTLSVLDINSLCSAQDQVVISVVSGNHPPVAKKDYDITEVNTSVNLQVLSNDTDPDGDPLNVSVCGNPAHGVIVINSDKTITYTPDDKYMGDDKFCYMICDNGTPSLCDTATVFLHIKAKLNDLDIYNLLTPNGDNSNDTWSIRGIEDFPDNTILIFNRWGDKVRDFDKYDNINVFWDGTNNKGEVLPSGTYYYILSIKNVGSRTGWIYLHGKEE
jgi:gliding motility-associated-like protein